MPKTGHIPMEEKPSESLRIALDFIQSEKDSINSIEFQRTIILLMDFKSFF